MVWLQSNEAFNKLAEFDPISKTFKEYLRQQLLDKQPKVCNGFFSRLGSSLIAIYSLAGSLFMLIDEYLFEVNNKQVIDVSGPAHARKLKIIQGSETVFEITYSLEGVARAIPGDPTAFIEDEDFDIGLFASNVSKDPERRAVFTATK
jgi:hypothetical protein